MKEYIAKVAEGENLTEEEAKKAMDIMLSGDATQAQIAAFLALERVKGETLDELAGFATVLRDKAETISPKVDNYIDLVGTDRIPSACDRICRFSVFYGFRIGNTSVSTEEIVAACVEAINVCVDRINGVMITAFAVFCFMIDRRIDYFYFSDI